MKLSTKLFLSVSFLTFTAVPALGLAVIYSTRTVLQASIEKSQLQAAREMMDTIDQTLYHAYQGIQIVAHKQAVDDTLLLTGPWDLLLWVDREGVIRGGDKERVGHSIREDREEWIAYKAALRGEVYYSDLVMTGEVPEPALVFAAPVQSEKPGGGPVVGVVIGHFPWAVVLRLFDEIDLPREGYLFNRQGLLIGARSATASKILEQNLARLPLVSDLVEGIAESGETSTYRSPNAALGSVLGIVVPQNGFLEYRGNRWGLLIEVPVNQAFAPINQIARDVAILIAIVMIFLAGLVFLIGEILTRPIRTLTQISQVIARGNFSVRAPVTTKDEVGTLAQFFNQMVARLEEKINELSEEITKRKELEKELQASKGRLEEHRRSLEIANKRLQELSELKDEFVANVSHELRTPLTAIKEGVNLMLDEVLGPLRHEQRDFLKLADESVNRLTELITNLLDLSKIEAGRFHLVRRKVSLGSLIEKTVKGYQMIAGHRTVKIDLLPSPDVFADPSRVMQVLVNLLSNAVKFTQEGGTITFLLEKRNGSAAVSVQDNGIGIPSEEQSKLFKKFSQVGRGSGRPQGTGLGLALCKKLVELHQGKITVASEPGKGTTFTFTLPFYTPWLALEENFKEILGFALKTEQQSVGLIACDARPLLNQHGLDPVEELIRRQVHHNDVVLSLDPSWVIILAMVDRQGLETMVGRLQKANPSLRFGKALYPSDGQNPEALLNRATGGSAQEVLACQR